MPDTAPLLITGMHRSGTSFIAQCLYKAGLFLGPHFNPPSAHNPEGYFEDAQIVRFHNEALAASGVNPSDAKGFQKIRFTEAHKEEAEALLSRQFLKNPVWGWKDPRTVLSLDFWDGILPQAKWIFVFRDPAQVVWSFLRRSGFYRKKAPVLQQALSALRLWREYNRRILSFVEKNPARCLLIFSPFDYTPEGQGGINQVLLNRWGFRLKPVEWPALYKPFLMQKRAPGWLSLLTRSCPAESAMFRRLQALQRKLWKSHLGKAHPANKKKIPHEARKPVIVMFSQGRFPHEEAFIQEQAECLPADMRWLYRQGGKIRENGARFLDKVSIAGYLRKERVRLVLAQYGFAGVDVMDFCRQAKIPLVVHFHGPDVYREDILMKNKPHYPKLFAAAKALIAVSGDMEEKLISLGAPREKIFYNPGMVDTRLFSGANPRVSEPLIVTAGRFEDKKSPYRIILAFQEAAEAHPEARLVMIGDGPLLETCRELAAILKLEEKTRFLGLQSSLEISEMMRSARVFVQHAVTDGRGDAEGIPQEILQAGASGLPVIATRHAGIPEVVIHEETGWLVAERDIGGMAKAMRLFLEDPGLAGRLGENARKRICENYAVEKAAGRLWQILEQAMT